MGAVDAPIRCSLRSPEFTFQYFRLSVALNNHLWARAYPDGNPLRIPNFVGSLLNGVGVKWARARAMTEFTTELHLLVTAPPRRDPFSFWKSDE
jgi:hypothetical protein